MSFDEEIRKIEKVRDKEIKFLKERCKNVFKKEIKFNPIPNIVTKKTSENYKSKVGMAISPEEVYIPENKKKLLKTMRHELVHILHFQNNKKLWKFFEGKKLFNDYKNENWDKLKTDIKIPILVFTEGFADYLSRENLNDPKVLYLVKPKFNPILNILKYKKELLKNVHMVAAITFFLLNEIAYGKKKTLKLALNYFPKDENEFAKKFYQIKQKAKKTDHEWLKLK